jgi:hypothetical protein
MDQEESQVKNLKRRLIDFINKTTPGDVIRLALFCKIKIPKQLIDKYLS